MIGYSGTIWLTVCWLTLVPVVAGAESTGLSQFETETIIHQRLEMYRDTFPDIAFVQAAGGSQWRDDYVALDTLLGEQSISLDYEHPPTLAVELNEVSKRRLAIMLRNNIVSASLFRTDGRSPLAGAPLCIVTLNPQSFAKSRIDATADMLDLPHTALARIPKVRLLEPRDHLLFTIDHEIFHCLESALLGGAPMTTAQWGGEYNLFRRENSADAFALAMHRRQSSSSAPYAQNIVLVRALWFFSSGPNYRTYESLREVLLVPVAELARKSVRELIALADNVRDRKVPGYEVFLTQHATALRAAQALGYAPSGYGEQWVALAQRTIDAQRVAQQVEHYRYFYQRLFDDVPLEFEPEGLPR